MSQKTESIDIYISDLFPNEHLPSLPTRQGYIFSSFPSLGITANRPHRNASSDAQIRIPFTSIVEMLQKACERQLESDIKNAALPKKPRAKKRQTSLDNRLQKELQEMREMLRNKDKELRNKDKEMREMLRNKDKEICNKDRALRLAERKARSSS